MANFVHDVSLHTEQDLVPPCMLPVMVVVLADVENQFIEVGRCDIHTKPTACLWVIHEDESAKKYVKAWVGSRYIHTYAADEGLCSFHEMWVLPSATTEENNYHHSKTIDHSFHMYVAGKHSFSTSNMVQLYIYLEPPAQLFHSELLHPGL